VEAFTKTSLLVRHLVHFSKPVLQIDNEN
jgi:hypothetical protein